MANRPIFPGKDAFDLHSTYGFPIELVVEMAREKGMEVDMAEYERLMEAHRAISRKGMFKAPPRRREDTHV